MISLLTDFSPVVAGAVVQSTAHPSRSMRFHAHSYLAFVLTPAPPIHDWLTQLDAWLVRSPQFFIGQPVVLNLAATDLSASAIAHLIANLEERKIRVMALEGGDPATVGPGLPPMLRGGRPVNSAALLDPPVRDKPVPAQAKQAPAQAKQAPSLVVDAPIRSGQSVSFMEGDVTVLGSVGSGAEIIAGGSIHVYGALRGRAMAGASGNPLARIFCNKIEAELLAIDGFYMTAEEIEAALRSRPAQAWLEGDVLKITALN
jgi:septum site-determining protein MinC